MYKKLKNLKKAFQKGLKPMFLEKIQKIYLLK